MQIQTTVNVINALIVKVKNKKHLTIVFQQVFELFLKVDLLF